MAKPIFISLGLILSCFTVFGQFDTAQYTRYCTASAKTGQTRETSKQIGTWLS